jgi:hypothetical protein
MIVANIDQIQGLSLDRPLGSQSKPISQVDSAKSS